MRSRNDLHAEDFADLAGGGRTGVDGGFHRGDVARDHDGHIARADFVPSDQLHVGRLERGVSRLNQGHKPLRSINPNACIARFLSLDEFDAAGFGKVAGVPFVGVQMDLEFYFRTMPNEQTLERRRGSRCESSG